MRKTMTKKELADVLGVSLRTVNRWLDRGIIPASRITGTSWHIDPADVSAWLAQKRNIGA